MMRWLRRLFWLGVLIGGGYGGYVVWKRRRSPEATAPQWPPLPVANTDPVKSDTAKPATARPATAKPTTAEPAAAKAQRWVAPINGKCPDGYPVKANDNSRIYHVPGGRFYDRTAAERCYASADDALADGYRPAKA
jgi:hypothetical protein